jgi:DNA polymerase III subunit delta
MSFAVEKALKARVLMLTGDEEALRRRALNELVATAAPDRDDFDLQTFDGGTAEPGEWVAAAGTAPFLSDRRTVVVRHVLRSDEPVDLSGVPDYGRLILVADDEIGDENRQRKFGTIRKAWEKAVNAAGGSVVAFTADTKGLSEAIRKECDSLGISITPGASQSLAEMTGGSLSRALDELEKLALYVGKGAQVRESDVRSVVMPSREWNVFRMVEAVAAGEATEALTQLRILIGSAPRPEEIAFSRILPMMSRQLRLMWQARVCVDARTTPESAPDAVAACFPDKPNIAKEPSYRSQKLLRSARSMDLERISLCLEAISVADAKLKGMLPAFSAIDTLESMLLEMVEVVRRPVARKA